MREGGINLGLWELETGPSAARTAIALAKQTNPSCSPPGLRSNIFLLDLKGQYSDITSAGLLVIIFEKHIYWFFGANRKAILYLYAICIQYCMVNLATNKDIYCTRIMFVALNFWKNRIKVLLYLDILCTEYVQQQLKQNCSSRHRSQFTILWV